MSGPLFPEGFDDVFDVGGIRGNPAYFGLDVLRGLVDGISDFSEIRQERWRGYRSLGTALLASSMWIDDAELMEAIGRMAAASVIVTKQGRRLRKAPLVRADPHAKIREPAGARR